MSAHTHSHAHDHGHPDNHGHDHGHAHHHGHAHAHGAGVTGRRLTLALALTLLFAAAEALAGWWSGSLALLSDAGHMLTDSLALALAALAARVAARAATERHSYGLRRAETLAGLINGLFMLLVVALIVWHAIERLADPRAIQGGTVTAVAATGLAVNLIVAWMLSHGEQDLNTRGALLHVMGDILGSIAALASGLVIQFTGWTPIDPLLSMLICGLIVASTLALLRTAAHTLLEGVPEGVSLPEVGRAMAGTEGVRSVHDLHIWSLDSRHAALSAHVVLHDLRQWPNVLDRLQRLLHSRYDIEHVTLQPEPLPGTPVVFRPWRSSGDDGGA